MKVPLDGEGQSPRRRERNQGLDRDLQHAFSVLARLAAHEMRGEGFQPAKFGSKDCSMSDTLDSPSI